MGRQNPVKAQMARVGNYVAPVDTTGMDESMKRTMGMRPAVSKSVAVVAKPKKKSLFDKFTAGYQKLVYGK